MKKNFPEIYKNKIEKLNYNVQNDYYFKNEKKEESDDNNIKKVDKYTLISKIDSILNSKDYVYQADVNIMLNNNKNINKKIIGRNNNYVICVDGEKIDIKDIIDIKKTT